MKRPIWLLFTFLACVSVDAMEEKKRRKIEVIEEQESISGETLYRKIMKAKYSNPIDHEELLNLIRNCQELEWNQNRENWTPLMACVRYGLLDEAKLLIERGADLGTVRLHFPAQYGLVDTVRWLLDNQLDVNAKDAKGRTALNLAIDHRQIEVCELLLERGASLNKKTTGYSLLFRAVKLNDLGICRLLIEEGAKVNASAMGGSPLCEAVRQGNKEIIAFLLTKGAKPKAPNGLTALHEAAKHNHLDICKMLVERDPGLVNAIYKGETPLSWAAREDNVEIVDYLISKGAQVDLESGSVFCSAGSEALKSIIRSGFKIDTPFKKGRYKGFTPLLCSILKGDYIGRLIENGADVNAVVSSEKYEGYTPLMLAIQAQQIWNVKLLLEGRADVNGVASCGNYKGDTPLLFALKSTYSPKKIHNFGARSGQKWPSQEIRSSFLALLLVYGAHIPENIVSFDAWDPAQLLWYPLGQYLFYKWNKDYTPKLCTVLLDNGVKLQLRHLSSALQNEELFVNLILKYLFDDRAASKKAADNIKLALLCLKSVCPTLPPDMRFMISRYCFPEGLKTLAFHNCLRGKEPCERLVPHAFKKLSEFMDCLGEACESVSHDSLKEEGFVDDWKAIVKAWKEDKQPIVVRLQIFGHYLHKFLSLWSENLALRKKNLELRNNLG